MRWVQAHKALVGIALLALGAPQFIHELLKVPGTPVLVNISSGNPVTDKDLGLLERSRNEAISILKHPTAYAELSVSYLLRAQRANTLESKKKYAEQAIEEAYKNLALAPLNTFVWSRVASANIALGPDKFGEALLAWRSSISSAKFDTFLILPRIHTGIILYQEMSDQDIAVLRQQVSLAFEWHEGLLKKYAKEQGLVDWLVFLSEPNSPAAIYLAE